MVRSVWCLSCDMFRRMTIKTNFSYCSCSMHPPLMICRLIADAAFNAVLGDWFVEITFILNISTDQPWKIVVLMKFSLLGIWCLRPWVQTLHSTEKKTCLLSILISLPCARASKLTTTKHVYRQSQMRMPNGSGVEWAECSLSIGTGCRVQVFILILDSSVSLSVGNQLAGDLVSETLG